MSLASLELLRRAGGLTNDTIGLEHIVIGDSALFRVPELAGRLGRPGPIVMLEDATPMVRDGLDLKELVAGLLSSVATVRRLVVGPDDGMAHADVETVAAAAEGSAGAGLIVSVGSGTITDIGKEASRIGVVPLMVVQTAASVNGYSDDLAVLLKDGVKRTSPSVWPKALVIDTVVLADAPQRLTRSGMAEMMAMFTAPADWYLASVFGFDTSFHPDIVDLFRPDGDRLIGAADEIGHGDRGGLGVLAHTLTSSGLAMGIAGRTAPLSGTEHLISHLLDMSARADDRLVGLHGAQVGVAALIAACLWERLLAPSIVDLAVAHTPSDEELRTSVEAAFNEIDPSGAMADECWADLAIKVTAWRELSRDMDGVWSTLAGARDKLSALVATPEAIASALGRAGAPLRFSELQPAIAPRRARWAVASSHLMRNRFTALDLAFFLGLWKEEDVDAVLLRAAGVGGGL